ncbi:hypothetical protein EDF70_1011335 [Neorhizobium sp. JUb45]|nr:hypothetical protein EDF70_1011335 [Neorhizobium sp. JUb45]
MKRKRVNSVRSERISSRSRKKLEPPASKAQSLRLAESAFWLLKRAKAVTWIDSDSENYC